MLVRPSSSVYFFSVFRDRKLRNGWTITDISPPVRTSPPDLLLFNFRSPQRLFKHSEGLAAEAELDLHPSSPPEYTFTPSFFPFAAPYPTQSIGKDSHSGRVRHRCHFF